jgi:hypothetical protein
MAIMGKSDWGDFAGVLGAERVRVERVSRSGPVTLIFRQCSVEKGREKAFTLPFWQRNLASNKPIECLPATPDIRLRTAAQAPRRRSNPDRRYPS